MIRSYNFLSIIIKVIIFLMINHLFNFLLAGETGKLSGKVIDKESQKPLVGVNIYIKDTNYGSSTNSNGEYFIINLPPDSYTIVASYIGYKSEMRTNVKVYIDKTTHVDYFLVQAAVEGDEVVVYSQRSDFIEPDLTATKQSYSINSMKSMPGMNDVGDIVNLQADVEGGHFRGSRSGEALFLINGNTTINPLNNSQALEPITLGLKEVEVYTSGFSSEYGNVQSGVVNMVQKEGNREKWETTLEYSQSNDRYKTWGGSIYSEDYNQYFSLLNDPNVWATETDPISGVILWSHFGIRFPENYMVPVTIINSWPPQTIYPSYSDSLRTASLVKAMWLQSVREIGLEYKNPDRRLSISSNGPLSDNLSLFIAGRLNESQLSFAYPEPNLVAHLMTTVTYNRNKNSKLNLIINNQWENTTNMTSNYYRWFERTLSITKEKNSANQIGIGLNKMINQSSYIDYKVNWFSTVQSTGLNLLGDSTYSEIYSNNTNWRFYTAPTGYSVGRLQTSGGNEKTSTIHASSSYTNQINNYNMVKAGMQLYYYNIDVNYRRSRSNESQIRIEDYNVRPYEGAVFIQNKLEFEGMIANLGLRYDFYNLNTDYFKNDFSPYRNAGFDPNDPESGDYYDPNLAEKSSTATVSVLQPRIGIAFPVTDKSVFHLNYGVFTQRPAFRYVYGERIKLAGTPNYELLGNPQLEPESTLAYDLGLVTYLPFGFVLDVSSYLKDVSNLLQYAVYEDDGGNRYFRYDNKEYADIKGFHINLEKNTSWIKSYLRYNWESSTGKSASATGNGARAEYFESDNQEDILPSPEDIYLDYNRLHKLVGAITIQTDSDYGFSIMRFNPLSNLSLSAIYRYSSGRPFTWDESGQGLQMNQRSPDEKDLKLRLEKTFSINQTNMKFYFEIFNVLNQKVFSYDRVFQSDVNSFNPFIERYMLDRENITTDVNFEPLVTSLDGYLYSNQPKYYRLGVSFEF